MLAIKGLTVFYGESQILTDVTVEVPSGKVVCLMGRNGVGKTTLLKAIMGVLKPRRGSVIFDSQDMTYFASHFRAQAGIGYVPQGRGIFPYLTVYENLLMGLEALNNKKQSAIADVYDLFPIL